MHTPALLSFLSLLLTAQTFASSMIYTPENFKPQAARVVVVIHGCLQTPESMALGTGWNQLADKNNLVVIYPQVPSGTHPIDCWSWFKPENQKATSGQLKDLSLEIQSWKKRLNISKAKTFVTGISSGGATVAGLLACFPTQFTAGAIHSGPSFGLVSNLADAERLLKEGPPEIAEPTRSCDPRKFRKPVMVIQGMTDTVVHPNNVKRVIKDYFPGARAESAQNKESGGMKFSVEDYMFESQLKGRVVKIEGLGHAWAGVNENLRHPALLGTNAKFPTQIPFFSGSGPSSTNLIFDFFNGL